MARDGLPVTGVNAESWEKLRPKIVHNDKTNKVWLTWCWCDQGVCLCHLQLSCTRAGACPSRVTPPPHTHTHTHYHTISVTHDAPLTNVTSRRRRHTTHRAAASWSTTARRSATAPLTSA
jgi:hypothetical protein